MIIAQYDTCREWGKEIQILKNNILKNKMLLRPVTLIIFKQAF